MLAEQEPVKNLNIEIRGTNYNINMCDIKDFLEQCQSFMELGGTEFEIITQSIADTIIDGDSNIPTQQLRIQLRFLREVGFFLKNFVANNHCLEV
jgi:hypothetical protein